MTKVRSADWRFTGSVDIDILVVRGAVEKAARERQHCYSTLPVSFREGQESELHSGGRTG
jgi:hypothetical protein